MTGERGGGEESKVLPKYILFFLPFFLVSVVALQHYKTIFKKVKTNNFDEISKSLLPVVGTFKFFKGREFDLQMQTLTRSFLQSDFASTQ